jgi:hypothetical protein
VRTHGSALAAASIALLLFSHGCGGSAFSSSGADGDSGAGGGDASAADGATPPPPEGGAGDATPPPAMCLLPPNGVGNEQAFCAFEADVLSHCGECEQCRQLDVNDCVSLGDALSPGFKSALKSCESTLGCGTLDTYAGAPCVRAALDTVAPTPSQAAVKTAYCTTCPGNPNECAGFFDLSKDGGPAGLGAFALVVSDALDQQIVAQCSSAAAPKCTAFDYGLCMALVFCGAAPHGHCPKGLCD